MREMSPPVKQAAARVVTRAIQARTEGSGRPFLIAHFITNRCMCDCRSCLWKHNEWPDVPLAVLQDFYLQAAEEGFLGTALSGGEPFMRKDLGPLVQFVKQEAGMPILLFTTGYYLERRMHEVLPHIDMLLLSLDSPRAERHDEIRGLPGLFDRLMQALEAVRRDYPELSLQFNCCVQKGIASEIDDLLQLTKDLGMHISFDVITEYRHGASGSRFVETDMGMPLPELRAVCEHLLEEKAQGAPILNSESYFQYFVDGIAGYKCHFPKLLMSVDGRGNVEDCLNLDAPMANIQEMRLKEIMQLPRFIQLRKDAEACHSCNSPTMVDLSNLWENPQLIFERGGIAVG